MASPHNVIPAVERDGYVETVTPGLPLHHGAAIPFLYGTAVILVNHDCTPLQLGCPARHQHRVHFPRNAQFLAADHHHEIRDHRVIEKELGLCTCAEIIDRSDLYEIFRRTGKPAVALLFHRKILDIQGFLLCSSGGGYYDGAAAVPGRIVFAE